MILTKFNNVLGSHRRLLLVKIPEVSGMLRTFDNRTVRFGRDKQCVVDFDTVAYILYVRVRKKIFNLTKII